MIRGAIAFALVLKIPVKEECGYDNKGRLVEDGCFTEDNYDLVVSTTLVIVLLSTIIFGTFMKPV